MGKEAFLAIGIITTVLSSVSVILQILQNRYLEALLSFLYTLAFAGFFFGYYIGSNVMSTVAISVAVPVTIAQAIHSHLQYRKSKKKEAGEQQ